MRFSQKGGRRARLARYPLLIPSRSGGELKAEKDTGNAVELHSKPASKIDV